jgi:hypothetical protein
MAALRVSLPVLLLMACGCATTQDALKDKESGTAKVYPVGEEQAWEIAKKVFRWEGTDAIEEDRANRVMITSTGTDAVTPGTVIACWIDPEGPGQTRVTVVTKRRYQLSLFTSLTEGTFHQRFAQAVEIVQSGQPLPLTPPPHKPTSQP